jgi:Chromo (CHRromatin Organisation MOdifier) domain
MKRVSDIYNISRLEPCPKSTIPGQRQEPPPPITLEGEPEWEVEEILEVKKIRNRFKYLVKWLNDDPTWQPYEDLTYCQDALHEFYTKYPQKPRPTTITI